MAAISVTAANVLPASDATYGTGISGGTLTAGMPIYIDASDSNKIKACDANASDAAAQCVGITLHAALSGQPIKYINGGNLTLNAALTSGIIYVAGATAAGDINPSADLTTGWRTTILGVATSTTNLKLSIFPSGATV